MNRLQSILHPRLLLPVLLAAASVPGCRAAEDGAGIDEDGGAEGNDDAGDLPRALLSCPEPGELPFETESDSFENSATDGLVSTNPRFKDEASDMLGNPGGPFAYTRLPVEDGVGDNLDRFVGLRARTENDAGLAANPIVDEWVSLWQFDQTEETWGQVDRIRTDEAGQYTISGLSPNEDSDQPIYAVLEGDGSCVPHYSYLLPAGTKFVITDIDGTLTLSDEELFTQIADGDYTPQENGSAQQLMNLWTDKGYQVVYLTARPHLFRAESRQWLEELGYPPGPMITANSLVFGASAREYKGTWLKRLTQDFGWEVVAAYGNADSDIQAYEDGAIPKDITFIVGPEAGSFGTQPILDNDFSTHIADFVMPFPDAD